MLGQDNITQSSIQQIVDNTAHQQARQCMNCSQKLARNCSEWSTKHIIELFCLVLVAVVFSPFLLFFLSHVHSLLCLQVLFYLIYLSSHETEDTFYIVCFIFILIMMVLSPENLLPG